MSGEPVNEWKLGLFVVSGVAVAFTALVTLGASRLEKEVLPFVTYFDESVQGLEKGSPVKFRGVTVGNVAKISIADDRRHVAVTASVDLVVLEQLGLRPTAETAIDPSTEASKRFVPLGLRVQLVSSGITGVKYLELDFFEPAMHPPPALPFATPYNYVPATSSTLKSVEEAAGYVLFRLPELTNKFSDAIDKVVRFLEDVDAPVLSRRLQGTLDRADASLATLETRLAQVDVAHLSSSALAAMDGLSAAGDAAGRVLTRAERQGGLLEELEASVASLRRVLARVEREDGLLARLESTSASLERELSGAPLKETVEELNGTIAAVRSTSVAVGDVVRDASGIEEELMDAVRAIEQAADAVRRLSDTLERDPDMLLKGRATRDE